MENILVKKYKDERDELREQLAKANERVEKAGKEIERLKGVFYRWKKEKDNAVWESDVVFMALVSETKHAPLDEEGLADKEWWESYVKKALNKFAIENQIKGATDYTAYCQYSPTDTNRKQWEEQLRKEQEK